jgi:hypothetical protein
MVTLSKSDKKIARILIDKSVDIEKTALFLQLEQTLADWRNGEKDVPHTYAAIYTEVKNKDKTIARRYDGVGGSMYFYTIAQLYDEGIIDDTDIAPLSDVVKASMKAWTRR